MARFVEIASVMFAHEHLRGQRNARRLVLEETRRVLKDLHGLGLDLVVLSEGVHDLAQVIDQAESIRQPGSLLQMYQEFAAAEQCHVAGPVKLREGRRVHNSLAFIGPDGQLLGAYHKVYLTRGELEMGLSPGSEPVVVDTPIGRLGGVICFDLNFDELRLRYARLQPDILTFASLYHGGFVQELWAYSCRAFLVSALQFHGSGILDPLGQPLALTDCYTTVARARINLDRVIVHLDYNREKFPDILRRHGDEVRIVVPPDLGSAIIYSDSDKRSASDVAREFDLKLLDDYFRESAELNARRRGRRRPAR